jgi:hypothetical protein
MKQELSYLQKNIIDNQNTLNVEDMWDKFKTTITALVKDNIPHKTAKSKDSQPWINNDIRKLIKRRDRLYKQSKKTGNQTINKKYKETKHHVHKLIRKAYWNYIENIITPKETDDTQFGTMKKCWTYIKHRKTNFNGITEIKHNGKLLTDPLQNANALNNQFYSVFTPVSNISRTDFNK